jgi:hypothetical protein
MRQNEKSNRALTKHLADQDPDRIVSVNEACRILGISRPTLYRHGAAAQWRRWARRRGDDMRTEKLSAVPPVRMSPDQICGLVVPGQSEGQTQRG